MGSSTEIQAAQVFYFHWTRAQSPSSGPNNFEGPIENYSSYGPSFGSEFRVSTRKVEIVALRRIHSEAVRLSLMGVESFLRKLM